MTKIQYIPWISDDLGITFSLSKGRISIFKRTLEAIRFPEYYHFLYNASERTLAIQACAIDDKGAHRLSVDLEKKYRCEVNCKSLVRFVYQTCGWEDKNSYRIIGVPRLEEQLIKFDLKSARKTSKALLQPPRSVRGQIVSVRFPVGRAD